MLLDNLTLRTELEWKYVYGKWWRDNVIIYWVLFYQLSFKLAKKWHLIFWFFLYLSKIGQAMAFLLRLFLYFCTLNVVISLFINYVATHISKELSINESFMESYVLKMTDGPIICVWDFQQNCNSIPV